MTAVALYRRCRRAGIHLTASGDKISFDAPADVTVPLEEMSRIKPELLAVLRGDYLHAALALVQRVADQPQREALADLFDERAGNCQYDGGMSRGESERAAYRELARTVEAMSRGNLSVPPEEQAINRASENLSVPPEINGVST